MCIPRKDLYGMVDCCRIFMESTSQKYGIFEITWKLTGNLESMERQDRIVYILVLGFDCKVLDR